MNSNKAPALTVLREILENVRDSVQPSKRNRWQRIIDTLDKGVDQYETIIAELEGEIHLLESEKLHGYGVDWRDILDDRNINDELE